MIIIDYPNAATPTYPFKPYGFYNQGPEPGGWWIERVGAVDSNGVFTGNGAFEPPDDGLYILQLDYKADINSLVVEYASPNSGYNFLIPCQVIPPGQGDAELLDCERPNRKVVYDNVSGRVYVRLTSSIDIAPYCFKVKYKAHYGTVLNADWMQYIVSVSSGGIANLASQINTINNTLTQFRKYKIYFNGESTWAQWKFSSGSDSSPGQTWYVTPCAAVVGNITNSSGYANTVPYNTSFNLLSPPSQPTAIDPKYGSAYAYTVVPLQELPSKSLLKYTTTMAYWYDSVAVSTYIRCYVFCVFLSSSGLVLGGGKLRAISGQAVSNSTANVIWQLTPEVYNIFINKTTMTFSHSQHGSAIGTFSEYITTTNFSFSGSIPSGTAYIAFVPLFITTTSTPTSATVNWRFCLRDSILEVYETE